MTSKLITTSIYNQIRAKILMSGPISVADYMKLALFQTATSFSASADPMKSYSSEAASGYYMGKDVFGTEGDFITSPEISQMFGEMVGVWGFQTWMQMGGPKQFSIVEMGPGRGTMAKDILRVFRRFAPLPTEISLHLIEISPYLANVQVEALCGKNPKVPNSTGSHLSFRKIPSVIDPNNCLENQPYYYHATTQDTNVPTFWYRDLASLPKGFHFYVAHEFFDVLPIHKLQKVENGWREILIDLHEEVKSSGKEKMVEKLRYVISRHETPAIKILQNLYESILTDPRNHLEVSLEAIQIYEQLCSRLDNNGGLSLVIDYGHEGTKEDTFRGFFRHKVLNDPLSQPGLADLTADVDFSLIRKICQEKVLLLGPVTQHAFLTSIGIGTRARRLYRSCKSHEEKQQLFSAYKMLLTELGAKFHCVTMLPKVMEDFRPKMKILGFDN